LAEGAEAIVKLQARFGDAVRETGSFRDQHWAVIDAKRWLEVARWLRDDESTAFNVLLDIAIRRWRSSLICTATPATTG
jgi:NADH:ubiquinone oxidoreductase subunit C